MPTLTLPLSQNPPFALLALGLLQDADIAWDSQATDTSAIKYGNATGAETVRAELEKGLPGKEVCTGKT